MVTRAAASAASAAAGGIQRRARAAPAGSEAGTAQGRML